MYTSRVRFVIFKMTNIREQRINFKFCVKLSKSFSETHKVMQNARGDRFLGRTQYYGRA